VKLLVDINVFEDIFRQQKGWEASLGIVASVANGRAVGYVSALTPPILYFFRRRSRSERADGSSLADFEDALQFAAASAVHVDAIVTRNKKHFRQRRIPVVDPEQALAAMTKA
jgi:predicted nucleic acid-binding protein